MLSCTRRTSPSRPPSSCRTGTCRPSSSASSAAWAFTPGRRSTPTPPPHSIPSISPRPDGGSRPFTTTTWSTSRCRAATDCTTSSAPTSAASPPRTTPVATTPLSTGCWTTTSTPAPSPTGASHHAATRPSHRWPIRWRIRSTCPTGRERWHGWRRSAATWAPASITPPLIRDRATSSPSPTRCTPFSMSQGTGTRPWPFTDWPARRRASPAIGSVRPTPSTTSASFSA